MKDRMERMRNPLHFLFHPFYPFPRHNPCTAVRDSFAFAIQLLYNPAQMALLAWETQWNP